MDVVQLLLCVVCLGQAVAIVYLTGMVKESHKAMAGFVEDSFISRKSSSAGEFVQARAIQKEADLVRKHVQDAPMGPQFGPQGHPENEPQTYTTPDGKELRILRPKL